MAKSTSPRSTRTVPSVRVVDEDNTGDKAFRTATTGPRTRSSSTGSTRRRPPICNRPDPRRGAERPRRRAPRSASPARTRSPSATREQRSRRPRRDPARRARRPGRAGLRLRLVPGAPPARHRGRVDPVDVPDAAGDHLPHRRLVHRPVPGRARSASASRSTTRCWSSRDGARNGTTAGTTTTRSSSPCAPRARRSLFSGVTVAIGLLALIALPVPFLRSIGYRRHAHPAGQRPRLAHAAAGDPGRHRPAGGLAADPAREPGEPQLDTLGASGSCGAVGGRLPSPSAVLVVLLIAVFLGVKIGLASLRSLAKSGPAYEALKTLEDKAACRPAS